MFLKKKSFNLFRKSGELALKHKFYSMVESDKETVEEKVSEPEQVVKKTVKKVKEETTEK